MTIDSKMVSSTDVYQNQELKVRGKSTKCMPGFRLSENIKTCVGTDGHSNRNNHTGYVVRKGGQVVSHNNIGASSNFITHKNRFWLLIELDNNASTDLCENKTTQVVVGSQVLQDRNNITTISKSKVSQSVHRTATNAVVVVDNHFLAENFDKYDYYDLALRFKSKNQEKLKEADHFTLFAPWDKQTAGKFGFIPISEQLMPVHQSMGNNCPDASNLHKIVKCSGDFNFISPRIQMHSQ